MCPVRFLYFPDLASSAKDLSLTKSEIEISHKTFSGKSSSYSTGPRPDACHVTSKTDDDNWNEKGEWVNAQFTASDGSVVIEWYQFDGDQLISWVQTKSEATKE